MLIFDNDCSNKSIKDYIINEVYIAHLQEQRDIS